MENQSEKLKTLTESERPKNMHMPFKNSKTFAETGRPLLVNFKGLEITPHFIATQDTILDELALYYGWTDFEDKIRAEGADFAFRHYLCYVHPKNINDITLYKFIESYRGYHSSGAEFIQLLYESRNDEVRNMSTLFRSNINWAGVARDIEETRSYMFLPDRLHPTTVYVFYNE